METSYIKSNFRESPPIIIGFILFLVAKFSLCAKRANFFRLEAPKRSKVLWLTSSVAIRGQHAGRKRSHSISQTCPSFVFCFYREASRK